MGQFLACCGFFTLGAGVSSAGDAQAPKPDLLAQNRFCMIRPLADVALASELAMRRQ